MIGSDILDSGKYRDIFNRLTQAYAKAKKAAENQLDPVIKAGIRQREYEKKNSIYKQRVGNIDQVIQDAGLSETLNIAK